MGRGFFLALLVTLLLCGCGGGGSQPVTLVSITVSPSTVTIAPGTTAQFKASGLYSNGITADLTSSVTWSSSDAGVATVNGQGLATAGNAGSTTIKAASGAVSGSATLTTAAVQSISVTPASPVAVAGSNQTIQFTARANFANGATQDLTNLVTWSSDNTAAATISPTGLVTVGAEGTPKITATFGSVSGFTTLTVARLLSMTITPTTLTLGATNQQFTAMGTLSNGTTTNVTSLVTWSSDNSSVISITGSGLASALTIGTANISASFQGITQTIPVTVAGPTSITVSPTSATVFTGGSQQFAANGFFADGSQRDITTLVTWSVTSSTPATGVATVNSAGLATGTANGAATITATLASTGGSSLSGSAQLVVKTLSSVTIAPANPTVRIGSTVQLAATGVFADGSSGDVTNQLNWTSSSTGVATVGNTAPTKGLVTGQTLGTTVITASFGNVSSSTKVTVSQSTVTPSSEVFVCDFGNSFLSLIDTGSNTLLSSSIFLSGAPKSVAVNPTTNLAYVTIATLGGVSVVDLTSDLVVATVSTGQSPWGVAVAGNRLYVSNFQGNTVSVIDVTPNSPTIHTVIASIPVLGPKGLAVNSTTHRLYVTSFTGNTISVFNTDTNTVIDTVNVGNGPTDVTVDPSANLVYVTNNFSSTVSVLSAANDLDQVIGNIPVGTGAQRLALDATAKLLYVTVGGNSNALVVINTNNNSVITSIPVGLNPEGVAVKPSASRIYVANNGGNTVSVINSLSNKVIATVTGLAAPSGIATYP